MTTAQILIYAGVFLAGVILSEPAKNFIKKLFD